MDQERDLALALARVHGDGRAEFVYISIDDFHDNTQGPCACASRNHAHFRRDLEMGVACEK